MLALLAVLAGGVAGALWAVRPQARRHRQERRRAGTLASQDALNRSR